MKPMKPTKIAKCMIKPQGKFKRHLKNTVEHPSHTIDQYYKRKRANAHEASPTEEEPAMSSNGTPAEKSQAMRIPQQHFKRPTHACPGKGQFEDQSVIVLYFCFYIFFHCSKIPGLLNIGKSDFIQRTIHCKSKTTSLLLFFSQLEAASSQTVILNYTNDLSLVEEEQQAVSSSSEKTYIHTMTDLAPRQLEFEEESVIFFYIFLEPHFVV